MVFTIMGLYLLLVTMFWFSISMLMDLILLILSIMVGAYLISKMFMSSWTSYLIVLAIVGGLMILYSFIVIMNPNLIEVIIVSKYLMYLIVMALMSFILLLCFISMEAYSTDFYLNAVLDQYVLVNYYSVYPYVLLYLFLIIFLLMMLFIVDFVVSVYSCSMVLM